MRRHKITAGYTFIELTLVIMVMAIMAAIALPPFFDFTRDAKRGSLRQMVDVLTTSIRNKGVEARLKCSKYNDSDFRLFWHYPPAIISNETTVSGPFDGHTFCSGSGSEYPTANSRHIYDMSPSLPVVANRGTSFVFDAAFVGHMPFKEPYTGNTAVAINFFNSNTELMDDIPCSYCQPASTSEYGWVVKVSMESGFVVVPYACEVCDVRTPYFNAKGLVIKE